MPAPVAIAVVSWNTRDLLNRCLSSLQTDVENGRAQVIVVDNASTDGSAEMVHTDHSNVTLIASDTNLGFGPAVNLAARSAPDAQWIAPVNADTRFEPNAISELLKAGESHPEAAIIAPRLLIPDGPTQHSVHPFPTLALTLAFNAGIATPSDRISDRLALVGHWNPERPRHVDWALGAALLVRRAAWEQLGGFDPDQWMYAEDLDLAWRARQLGWRTWYEPAARVEHVGAAATTQAFGEKGVERWVQSTYGWMIRRRGPRTTRAYALINALGALARARQPEKRAWARLHVKALFTRTADLERHR